jgi:hypothetical protein
MVDLSSSLCKRLPEGIFGGNLASGAGGIWSQGITACWWHLVVRLCTEQLP